MKKGKDVHLKQVDFCFLVSCLYVVVPSWTAFPNVSITLPQQTKSTNFHGEVVSIAVIR